MNPKRMKFAWARGARFQRRFLDNTWVDIARSTPPVYPRIERIHPDDAHLEYGPLSTALREWALDIAHTGDSIAIAARYACGGLFNEDAFCFLKETSPIQVDMYRLFLAEMLADEGL